MSTPLKEVLNDSPSATDPWSKAPFDARTAEGIRQLIRQLSAPQRLWLSGFLFNGALSAEVPVAAAPAAPTVPAVTIVYGSQSGNCERLAAQIGQVFVQRGIPHIALDMLDCRKNHLLEAQKLLVVVSTHGEGDPPDRAAALHELLNSRKAPSLKHLQYSVLALGDSSYEKFCETGRQFDARLSELGAQSFHARIECDVDYEQLAEKWIAAVVDHVARDYGDHGIAARVEPGRTSTSVATAYTRKNPFHAPVLANQRLTARDAEKDVRHIELSLEGSGIHYEPGDALGFVVRNSAENVDALLAALPYAAEIEVAHESTQRPLREVLQHSDIGPVTQAFTKTWLERIGAPPMATVQSANLGELVKAYPPASISADEFARLLRPLAPRLYSIASSARATPDEVHLAVALEQFELDGRRQFGVASALFAGLDGPDLDGKDATAPVYLQRNSNFRLPADPNTPIIMIGPGTGVAPFRGFIAERDAVGARGRNWLFYGGRNFRSDFLYQTEWLDYRKRGALHRIELAFSRDRRDKVYVQHRMLEHGRELYAWLQDGAHVYVCGDAQHMAHDVQEALAHILAEHGGHSAERAAEDLLELQRARRYQRDVY